MYKFLGKVSSSHETNLWFHPYRITLSRPKVKREKLKMSPVAEILK